MPEHEINGDDGNNIIKDRQGAGTALIRAGAGDDQVLGRDGNDNIYGGYGSDIIHGGSGFDYLSSFSMDGSVFNSDLIDIASDRLYGEGGPDSIHLFGGFFLGPISSAEGGAGDDSIVVYGQTRAFARGGVGADSLISYSTSSVSFYGDGGRDSILTTSGESDPWGDYRDAAHGGSGNDFMVFDYDDVHAGAGDDYLIFSYKDAVGPGRTNMYADIHLGAGADYLNMYVDEYPLHDNLNWLHIYAANVKQGDHSFLNVLGTDNVNRTIEGVELDSNGDGRINRKDVPLGDAAFIHVIEVDDNLQLEVGNTRIMFVGRTWIETDFFS